MKTLTPGICVLLLCILYYLDKNIFLYFCSYSTTVTKSLSLRERNTCGGCKQGGRLKPIFDYGKQINKRIRLNTCSQNDCTREKNEKKRQNDVRCFQ